jgi:hypothetical protein
MKASFLNKRRFFWLLGALVALAAVLLVALTILLPRFINSEDFKKRIATRFSEQIGGHIAFEDIDLSYLPLLHIVIRRASLAIPGKADGTIGSLHVYSELLPLLTGEVRISKIYVKGPDFDITLPPKGENQAAVPPALSLAALRGQLPAQLDLLAAKAPGLVVSLEKARVRLLDGDQPRFSLSDINGRFVLPPESVRIEMVCGSDLWEKASVRVNLDAKTLNGKGRIELTGFRLGPVAGYLTQGGAPLGPESVLNLTVDLATDGLRDVKGTFQGSIPNLTIPQEKEDLVIRAKTLTGTFDHDEDRTVFALTEMSCDYPQLDLRADLRIDRKGQQVSLKLEGRDVDVVSTRNSVLGLAGEVSAVRKVFEIVKGGRVPLIVFQIEGDSVADLTNLDNIRIEGRILDGKMHPPAFQGDVEEVKGDVVIAKGVLEGQNLEGREGNAWGRNGTLRVGLKGKDAPFQLDIEIETDLASVPPVLNRYIKSTSFRNEMKRVKGLQGKAIGRLILGESLASIKTRVEISQLDLSARYDRIPFLLKVSRGRFSYRDTGIKFEDLWGRFGKSGFSKLSAGLTLGKTPYLEVTSAKLSLVPGELFSWLSSLEALSQQFQNIKLRSLEGLLRVDALKFKGPLLDPGKSAFDIRGGVKEFVVDTGLFTAPIRITQGDFDLHESLKEQRASLKEVQFEFLDTSLKVSGALDDYLKGLNRVDITVAGSMGADSIEMLSGYVELPSELDLKWAPVSFPNAHLVWERDRLTSFEGDLVIQEGPTVSLGLLLKPEEIHIKNLLIQDQASRATFALRLQQKALDLKFSGNLAQATLDKIFLDTRFSAGRMEGDLQAKINLEQPMGSTAQGSLMAQDFVMPVNLEAPLTIEEVSLTADGPHVRVDSGRFSCGENIIALTGDLTVAPDGLTLDMDVSSPDLDLERVRALLKPENEKSEPGASRETPELPLRGEVRFKADGLKVKDFTWRPFQADVTFSPSHIQVKVAKASELCGIATPGTLEFTPQQISLAFQPAAEDTPLEATVDCLFEKERKIKGQFDIKADISAQGEAEELIKSLKGDFEHHARDGQIEKDIAVSRLLAFLNVTEVFRGKLPDFEKEGFKFKSITLKGVFQEGKLSLKEGTVDSPNMRIACTGDIDYLDGQLDLKILVAPLKTVDSIVNIIPLVRRIFNKGLVTVPVSLTGPWKDPKVKTMAAEDVGAGLLGILKNTVTLPVTIFEPVMLKKDQKTGEKKDDVGDASSAQPGR